MVQQAMYNPTIHKCTGDNIQLVPAMSNLEIRVVPLSQLPLTPEETGIWCSAMPRRHIKRTNGVPVP